MKSGPTLNGCTARPRRRSAAINPSATVVLPTPLCVRAMRRAGTDMSRGTPQALLEPADEFDHRSRRDWCLDTLPRDDLQPDDYRAGATERLARSSPPGFDRFEGIDPLDAGN